MYLTKTNFGFDFICQNKATKNIKKKKKTFLSDFGKNFHVTKPILVIVQSAIYIA